LPDKSVMTKTTQIPCLTRSLVVFFGFCLALSAPHAAYAAGGGGAAKGSNGDSPFIAQTQIATSVLVSFRPVGVFQVDMGLYVTNQSQRQRILAMQPVLRNAWRRTTQEFTNSYYVRGRVPDAVLLGQRLQAATDEVLGVGAARVLLASVVVR
jgi:hypothetical protein